MTHLGVLDAAVANLRVPVAGVYNPHRNWLSDFAL
jgi:hypothetical protein